MSMSQVAHGNQVALAIIDYVQLEQERYERAQKKLAKLLELPPVLLLEDIKEGLQVGWITRKDNSPKPIHHVGIVEAKIYWRYDKLVPHFISVLEEERYVWLLRPYRLALK